MLVCRWKVSEAVQSDESDKRTSHNNGRQPHCMAPFILRRATEEALHLFCVTILQL